MREIWKNSGRRLIGKERPVFLGHNKLQERQGLERRTDLWSEEIAKLTFKMYMKSKYEQFFTVADTDPQLTKLVFLCAFSQSSNFIACLVNLHTPFPFFPSGR